MDERLGMPNPVVQQGQCVTNCTADSFFIHARKTRRDGGMGDSEYVFCRSGDSESFYVIMPRELAFRLPMGVDASIGRSNVVSTASIVPKVFTSLNNFPVRCTKDANLFKAVQKKLKEGAVVESDRAVLKRLLRELLCRAMVFMGVPLIRVNPAENMSASVSVTVGGTVTVYNTGNLTIEAGQKVAWDVPDVDDDSAAHSSTPSTRIRGEPTGKVFAQLVPVPGNGLTVRDSDAYMDPAKTLQALKKANVTASCYQQSSIYNDTLQYFEGGATPESCAAYLMTGGVTSRVIGTALSTASRGQSFDLLLQS